VAGACAQATDALSARDKENASHPRVQDFIATLLT
jgi:hypothetical protein